MRLVRRLVGTCARRYARRAVARGGDSLREIEAFIRMHAVQRGVLPQSMAGMPLPLRLVYRLDPGGFIAALRHGHYTALRKSGEPVWRNYDFRGFQVVHDIRNKSQWNAFARGVHQPGVTHWLRELAAPGACALDIGANAGVLTLELAHAVGAGGRVHAFEPNPDAYSLLRQAIVDNDLGGLVHPHPFALGVSDATMTLAIPEANNGAASLRQPLEGERSIDAEVRSFEHWWRAEGRPRVDCVKLDVEGFEATVVEALSPMLREHRPGLVMELSPQRYDAVALLDRLAAMGYRIMRISENPPYAVPLPDNVTRQMDIVCLPQ